MPSVPALLHEIQVEGTFKDGVFLVTVHDPIASLEGDITLALYGSFFPIPKDGTFTGGNEVVLRHELPGAVVVKNEVIKINVGRERVKLRVTNTGDRPIQVRVLYIFLNSGDLLTFRTQF